MSQAQTKALTIFSPAKINLYLHVTGRLDNGYHVLDSLIGFVDIGDHIEISPASDFEFRVDGPYAKAFNKKELDASPHSANLVVQAAWAMAMAAQKVPAFRATLTKNIPLASGLGGGSADAAALIWGLLEWWDIPAQAHYLPGVMSRLGADVPVCLRCKPARVRGIGDILDPAPPMKEVAVVLVNPGRPCPTAPVFARFAGPFREPQSLPQNLENFYELIGFLERQDNDLHAAACEIVPEISHVLVALRSQKNCALARLSGAGPTCFGLFENAESATSASKTIARENPGWWVRHGWLGRPERY
jgi:4-diphosphocytidyl-2-C-methyl-D-erythritol kinase